MDNVLNFVAAAQGHAARVQIVGFLGPAAPATLATPATALTLERLTVFLVLGAGVRGTYGVFVAFLI